MAMNDEARAEAAAFVRAGRISMGVFARTRLHLSTLHPKVGDQLVIEWEVNGAGDPRRQGFVSLLEMPQSGKAFRPVALRSVSQNKALG